MIAMVAFTTMRVWWQHAVGDPSGRHLNSGIGRNHQKLGHIASIPILGGLHHQYFRV